LRHILLGVVCEIDPTSVSISKRCLYSPKTMIPLFLYRAPHSAIPKTASQGMKFQDYHRKLNYMVGSDHKCISFQKL